jgi:uncharacterized protein (TIGR02466 family)
MDQQNGSIKFIFPTPVGFYELGRQFTTTEIDFVTSAETRKNVGNQTSRDHKILENPALSDIKTFVSHCVNKYFQEIYQPKHQVSLRITQSWCNYTQTGEFHHKHTHPNSFISGVFYIQVDEFIDKIYFYNEGHKQLEIPAREFNMYNSTSWWFPCLTGQLLLFPSSCYHMVDNRVDCNTTRISLSFNTFLVGNLGDDDGLTALEL